MNYEVMVKHILYEFEVTQKYVAYKYILKGMILMRKTQIMWNILRRLYTLILPKNIILPLLV